MNGNLLLIASSFFPRKYFFFFPHSLYEEVILSVIDGRPMWQGSLSKVGRPVMEAPAGVARRGSLSNVLQPVISAVCASLSIAERPAARHVQRALLLQV